VSFIVKINTVYFVLKVFFRLLFAGGHYRMSFDISCKSELERCLKILEYSMKSMLVLLCCFLLACNDDDNDSSGRAKDPILTILSPSSGSEFSYEQSSIMISGRVVNPTIRGNIEVISQGGG